MLLAAATNNFLTNSFDFLKENYIVYHPGLFQRGYRGTNIFLFKPYGPEDQFLAFTVRDCPNYAPKTCFFSAYLAFWKGVMQKVNRHPDGLLQHRHIRNQIRTSAAVSKMAKKSPTGSVAPFRAHFFFDSLHFYSQSSHT